MKAKFKRILLLIVGMVALGSFGVQGTVSAAAIPRVAILISYDTAAAQTVYQGIKAHLGQLGKDVKLELFPLQKDADKATAAMQKIKRDGVDLIIALGTLALNVACENDSDIPVIATMVLDQQDLEKCVQTTGVALEFSLEEQFDWLKRFFPAARNIGVIYNPADNSEKISLAREVAKQKGFRLQARKVNHPKELPAALDSLANSTDVLWGITDRQVLNTKTAKSILLFSFRNKIPFVGLSSAWVKAGAFYALDRDYADIGRQCGEMVEKVLGGAKVTKLAVARPQKVNYSLNLKAAEKMKVKLAQALVKGAVKTY